jgi:hypothetical protein
LSAPLRSPDGKEGNDPAMGEALARLQKALEEKDVEAMDSALAGLQALPLTEEMRGAVGEIADGILTADIRKALDTVIAFPGRENRGLEHVHK